MSRAADKLRVSHSTLSDQLKQLEGFFGQALFDRRGRRLVLTEFGQEAAQYATDIFHLGYELVETARGRIATRKSVFRVGVLGSIPKTIVYWLLEPSLAPKESMSVQVKQGDLSVLIGMLSRNAVHVVIADQPPKEAVGQKVHTHKLGDTEIAFYGSPKLAARYRNKFPSSLNGAPMLLPSKGSRLRQSLDRWLADHGLSVKLVGEIDDAALLRTFGAFEQGVFPVRSVLAEEVEETHHVRLVGPAAGIRESYYAVSNERRVTHPQVSAVINEAKKRLLCR